MPLRCFSDGDTNSRPRHQPGTTSPPLARSSRLVGHKGCRLSGWRGFGGVESWGTTPVDWGEGDCAGAVSRVWSEGSGGSPVCGEGCWWVRVVGVVAAARW